jgi:uncharacterized membrane protein YfcA
VDPLGAIVSVLTGLIVGVLSGMLGIGGGTMITPVLSLFFGAPMFSATSTSLFTILPTSLTGAIRHVRLGTGVVATGLTVGSAGACASWLTAYLSPLLSELAIAILTSAVIVYAAYQMLRRIQKGDPTDAAPTVNPKRPTRKQLAACIGIGLFAGAAAGLVGVGGGFVIVPFLAGYMGYNMKQAAGTSLLAVACIVVPAIITHAILGHIWWTEGLFIVVGTVPGAWIGSKIVQRIPDRPLRFGFCGVLAIAAVSLIVKQVI